MKAISLWQPWASLVAIGLKRFETRHWRTVYRGPLAIHAAKRKPSRGECILWYAACTKAGIESFDLPLGGIVATCYLLAVVPVHIITFDEREAEKDYGDFSPGRFAWRLVNVKPLKEPIPCVGRQGFFNVDIL